MLARQRSMCACGCGRFIGAPFKFHVDHIVALSRGGGNGPKNLQLLAPLCNLRKGSR